MSSTNAKAHGYTIQIDPPQISDEGTADELHVPAAAHIEYQAGGEAFQLMAGPSPVDGQMVIHVDTEPGLPLARLYLNDSLVYGSEAAPDAEPAEMTFTVLGYWNDEDEPVAVGVIAGDHPVGGGEGATEGGDWATSVTAKDMETAEELAVEEMAASQSTSDDEDDDDEEGEK